jgi:hypothetical protein
MGFPPFHSHYEIKQQLEINGCFFLLLSFLIFTRSLPAFGEPYRPQCFIPFRSAGYFHCIPAVLCLRPRFWRFGSSLSHRADPLTSYVILEHPFSVIHYPYRFSWFVLHKSQVHRQAAIFYFLPPFHAHIRYVSLRTYAQLSRPMDGACSIAATRHAPHPQKKVPCPQWGTFFAPCLLMLDHCRSHKNSPENNNNNNNNDSAFFRKKEKIQQI